MSRSWNPLEKNNRGTIGRQFLQGGTLGFADEAMDYPAALAAYLLQGTSKENKVPFKEILNDAREVSKQRLGQDWKEAPLYSFGANVAGGIPLAFGKTAQGLSNWARGGSMLGAIGKGAAVGAGYGAAAGMGTAAPSPEDDLAQSLYERAAGGGRGAAFGGVLGGLAGGLSKYLEPPSGPNFGKVGKTVSKQQETKAEKYLAKILAERPDLKEQLARAEAMNTASKNTGIQLTLPEKIAQSSSDPLLGQQRILGNQPQTAGAMEKIYAGRSGTIDTQGSIEQQLIKLAKELDPKISTYDEAAQKLIQLSGEAQKKATKELTSKAGPLYSEAFKANQVIESKKIERILNSDTGREAIKSAASNMSDDLLLASKPDKELTAVARELGLLAKGEKVGRGYKLQTLDYVKRHFDDLYEVAKGQRDYPRMRQIEKFRGALVNELDNLDVTAKAGPNSLKIDGGAYARARAVYSGNPDKLQLRERIGDLADIDPLKTEAIGRELFKGRPAQAEVVSKALGPEGSKTAAAARIYDVMGQARGEPTTFASKIAPNADTAKMLQTYAGGNQLDETLNVINQAKIGDRFRYGSPTQPLQESAEGMKQAAGGALDLVTGNKIGLARKAIGLLGGGEDPKFYQDMLNLMTTDQGMELVRRVANQQGTAVQKQQAANQLMTMMSQPAQQLSRPIQNAAIMGINTPRPQSVVFKPQEDTALPQGYVIRQQAPALPAGYTIRGVQ